MATNAASGQPPSSPQTSAVAGNGMGRTVRRKTRTKTKAKPTSRNANPGLRVWFLEHQISISLTLLLLLAALHPHHLSLSLNPTEYTDLPLPTLLRLSYAHPTHPTLYGRGWGDAHFVATCVVAFTALRAGCVEYVFKPYAASKGLGVKAGVRFAEQGWQFVYYGVYLSVGMYLWTTSPYWLNFRAIWADWPIRHTSGAMKAYTLSQLGFWFHQIVVLNVEERRKDYGQMLFHHIITSGLLGAAYVYGFFNVANVVLCLMDVVDLLLPAAKMLKYLGHESACNAVFALFFVSWLIPRHVIYNMLWYSIYREVPSVMPYGCHSTTTPMTSNSTTPSSSSTTFDADAVNDWTHLFYPLTTTGTFSEATICMSRPIKWGFLTVLAFLQGLSLVWFGMIVGVLVKMVVEGRGAEDTRSDGEEEGGEGEEIEETENETEAEEVVDVNKNAKATGVEFHHQQHVRSIRGPRKELLGRIGCEKPTNAD